MYKTKCQIFASVCQFFLLSTLTLSAQSQFFIKNSFDKNAGFTQRPVCMLEDRDGFFWIGTHQGLFRFDGSQVREIHFVAQEDSLATLSRKIFTLALDKTADLLWIGTGSGIFKYHLYSGKTEKLNASTFFPKGNYKFPECRVLYQDRQGELWANFAVPGLVHLKDGGKIAEQFTCAISQEEDAESMGWDFANSILCLLQDRLQDSILWAGTRAGLIKFNKNTRTIRRYYFSHPDKNRRTKANAMRALYQQEDGRRLYIGTYNGGLLVFNPYTAHFDQYLVQPEADLEKTRKNNVDVILPHGPQALWISQQDKLFLFHTQTGKFTQIQQAGGLDFIDRAGNYWNSVETGLELYHHSKNQVQQWPFPNESVYQAANSLRVWEDTASQNIFVRTEGIPGMPVFNQQLKQWKTLTFPTDPSLPIIGHVLEKNGSGILVNDNERFYSLSAGQSQFKRISLGMVENPGWLSSRSDAEGNVFITGNRGYLFWLKREATKVQTYYRTAIGEPVPNHFNTLSIENIDDQGRPWIACSGGFSLFLPDQNRFLHVSASLNPNRHFAEYRAFGLDRTGKMWSLSQTEIGWIDPNCPEEGLQQRFGKDNGFPFVELGGNLTTDKNGRFWLSSRQDLIRFDPEKLAYTVFEDIGKRKVSVLASGELAFLRQGGIGLIHPDSLLPPKEQPKPYISWFKVFEKEVPLIGNLLSPQEIRLGSEENFFSIGFSALGFYNPEKYQFSYYLEGVDKGWVRPEPGNRIASYTDLRGGNYVFRLNVTNSLGQWRQAPLEWRIHVDTPWWETGRFRLLVVAAIISAVYFLFKFRLQQQRILLENKQLQLEKEIALRKERDRIAAEMHDDLGAGLSTIRFLSLVAKEKEVDAVKAGRIDKIARSAAEVMEKMADIIWVMNSRNDSLENFASYFRRYAGDYLDTHGIRLVFDLPENLLPLLLSGEQRRTLLLALKECLHNVVKHAGATELHLQIYSRNSHLEITIQDNGKGFPLPSENNDAIGNGLLNIQRRMETLGGTALIENGNGVKVILKTGILFNPPPPQTASSTPFAPG